MRAGTRISADPVTVPIPGAEPTQFVRALAPLAAASASMARINFDAAAKRAPHEANLRHFFEVIAPSKLLEELKRDQPMPAINEQPFISPLAWAYFSAYQSIILGAFMAARILAEGIEDAGKLLKRDHARELLKATLPHQAEYIDGNDPAAYHHLLEELKELLLTELRNILDGQAADREAINRGNEITGVLRKIEAEDAERRAANPKVREVLTEIGRATGV
jgi:hypothetical protein